MIKDDELCLCCGTLQHAGFRELVEAASAGGFRSISVWPQHYENARSQGLSDADMRSLLNNHGLVISELDPLMNWLPETGTGLTTSAPAQSFAAGTEDLFFHIADALGARHLNLIQAFGPRMNTEIIAAAFAGVCDRAARHDLKVSLEFLPWSGISDVKIAMEIVELADRPNGGILLDTWHHFRAGQGNKELLELPQSAIIAIQINDAAPSPADDIIYETMHGRLLPGHGAIDLVNIIRALDAIGCQATVGVEVFSDELNKLPPREAARQAGDATRAIFEKARQPLE